jgi:tetratricopeptide (TPR) repeat protein
LREILEQRARSAGRWAGHHAACARALLARADRPGGTAWAAGSFAERLGRHRFEAGEWEGCLVPLLNGARARRESSDYAAALRLLAGREQALVALSRAQPAEAWATQPVEVDATSPALLEAWAEGWALRARIHLHEGRAREAQHWSEHASRASTPEIAAEAHRLLGDAARRMGELERAQALYRVAIAAEAGQHSTAASLYGLGDSLRQLGDTEGAATSLERSRAIYAVIADVHGIADTALGSGDLARHHGELTEAERCYRHALALFDGAGNRYGVARAWNGLGEASRLAGRYPVAESFYRRSAEALHDLGSADETFPRVNLALLELARGRADATLEMLEEQWPRPKALGWGGLLPFLSAAQFAAASMAHEWGTAEAALLEVAPDARELPVCDPDLAITLEAGARACLGTAHAELGRRALAVAIGQRVKLGDRVGEARLRALVGG